MAVCCFLPLLAGTHGRKERGMTKQSAHGFELPRPDHANPVCSFSLLPVESPPNSSLLPFIFSSGHKAWRCNGDFLALQKVQYAHGCHGLLAFVTWAAQVPC